MSEPKVLATLTQEELDIAIATQNEIQAIELLQENLVKSMTKARAKQREAFTPIERKYGISGQHWHIDIASREVRETYPSK